MEQNNQSYLVTEKVGKLMGKYAVPLSANLLVRTGKKMHTKVWATLFYYALSAVLFLTLFSYSR